MVNYRYFLGENPLPEELRDLQLGDEKSNLTIKVGNEFFKVHLQVMATSTLSPVLRAKFSENWSPEVVESELSEDHIAPEIGGVLFGFLYTGSIILTPDTAHPVWMAAHYLGISPLMLACEKSLSKLLYSDIALEIFQLGCQYERKVLVKRSIDFISLHPESLHKEEILLSLTEEEMNTLLKGLNNLHFSPQNHCQTVASSFEALASWTRKNLVEREPMFPGLFALLSLKRLSREYLMYTVLTDPLVAHSTTMIALVNTAMEREPYPDHSGARARSRSNSPSPLPVFAGKKLYCFGGSNDQYHDLSTISCLNLSTGEWSQLSSSTYLSGDLFCDKIDSKIYIYQRYTEAGTQPTAEVFDIETETWSELPLKLGDTVQGFSMTACRGLLYFAGGVDARHRPQNKVYMYNPADGQWSPGPSMTRPRTNELKLHSDDDGWIYALGGTLQNMEFDSDDDGSMPVFYNPPKDEFLEGLNPATNQWSALGASQYGHIEFQSAIYDGHLYVKGDSGFERFHRRMYRFQKLSSSDNINELTMVTVGGKLWGMNWSEEKNIFQFEPSNRKWRMIGKMPQEHCRWGHCAIVMDAGDD